MRRRVRGEKETGIGEGTDVVGQELVMVRVVRRELQVLRQ